MTFGKKHSTASARAAGLAAGAPSADAATPSGPVVSYAGPDALRFRMNEAGETPEALRMRLRVKTINFGSTFLARGVIMAGACNFMLQEYRKLGIIDQRIGFGIVAMGADFTRVLAKCLRPGTK